MNLFSAPLEPTAENVNIPVITHRTSLVLMLEEDQQAQLGPEDSGGPAEGVWPAAENTNSRTLIVKKKYIKRTTEIKRKEELPEDHNQMGPRRPSGIGLLEEDDKQLEKNRENVELVASLSAPLEISVQDGKGPAVSGGPAETSPVEVSATKSRKKKKDRKKRSEQSRQIMRSARNLSITMLLYLILAVVAVAASEASPDTSLWFWANVLIIVDLIVGITVLLQYLCGKKAQLIFPIVVRMLLLPSLCRESCRRKPNKVYTVGGAEVGYEAGDVESLPPKS